MKKSGQLFILLMVVGMLAAGCTPYKGEKFVEVQNNETAFVIPLEGNLKKQQKLKSLEALESYQVAVKRINIKANGEAEAIRVVANAAAEAKSNPAFLALRKLEVEAKRIGKWNGQYPQQYWNTNGSNGLGILVNTGTK